MNEYIFSARPINGNILDASFRENAILGSLYSGFQSSSTYLKIYFSIALDQSQLDELDLILANHVSALTPEQQATLAVINAENFGHNLCIKVAAQNIALGITQAGLTNHVRRVTLNVRDALMSGSLYDAIAELKLIDPIDFDPIFITPERVLSARNDIETYLGLPLATTWDE